MYTCLVAISVQTNLSKLLCPILLISALHWRLSHSRLKLFRVLYQSHKFLKIQCNQMVWKRMWSCHSEEARSKPSAISGNWDPLHILRESDWILDESGWECCGPLDSWVKRMWYWAFGQLAVELHSQFISHAATAVKPACPRDFQRVSSILQHSALSWPKASLRYV